MAALPHMNLEAGEGSSLCICSSYLELFGLHSVHAVKLVLRVGLLTGILNSGNLILQV